MLNGPFAIVLGFNGGMVALNDRIKLRPLVAARKGDLVVVASEESAIRQILPDPDALWAPEGRRAGRRPRARAWTGRSTATCTCRPPRSRAPSPASTDSCEIGEVA